MNSKTILIVDDDESVRRVTEMHLADAGYDTITAQDGSRAWELVRTASPALIISDVRMPGFSGTELLAKVREYDPDLPVILITAYATVQVAVDAMKAGARDYITKPLDYDELLIVIKRTLEHRELVEEVRVLRTSLDAKYGFENIVGSSPALLRVLEFALRAAARDSTVLIHGETGTGKELLARAIHRNSARSQKPFVTINSGAIPKDLLESELFGHAKGSFTGALLDKRGKVEHADGGTLFLDEIGELPLELQVKLLRLIQNGEIEKVGATKPGNVDVRIIAATHRNLRNMMEDGSFREDLYYRLAVIPLDLPPLRERPDDILDLVDHLFDKMKRKHAIEDLRLSPSLLPYFVAYRWPGNIRELENVIERLVVLSSGGEITLRDLPDALQTLHPESDALHLEMPAHGISLETVEKELITRALQKFEWNQTQAARYLDISRRTLIYRMEKHGLTREAASAK